MDNELLDIECHLKDNYHLLIIDLPENGRKMILFQQNGWDNTVKGVY